MSYRNVPRAAVILMGVGLLFILLSGIALATDQPAGVFNLALGIGLGINVATSVMMVEVRKARGEGGW